MFSPVSSTRIPDNALRSIVEHLDFRSIQALRKTCCDLRNYVDDVQLNTHMAKIRITVYSEAIYLQLEFDDKEEKKYHVGYQKNRDGCCVRRYDGPEYTRTRMIRNANFLTIFCEDLRVILSQQASLLPKFELTFEHYNFENQNNRIGSMEFISAKIIDNLDEVLKSRRTKLQVEEFEIEIMDQTRIPSILSHIDSRKLKKITLASAELRARESLKIEELEHLDQWNNAKVIEIYQFMVTKSIKSFLRFEKVNIVLETIMEADLLFLRQSFLQFSHLKSFKIHSKCLNSSLNLVKLFGQPYDDTDKNGSKRRRWFCSIPKRDHEILMIHYDFYSCIHYCRVKPTCVPRNTSLLIIE